MKLAYNSNCLHPEPTTQLGPEDQGNGTLTVQGMKALQVIEGVDLVKGKRTLVRTTLNFNKGTNPSPKTATIKVYLNNTLQTTSGNNTPTLQDGTQNIDLFFTNTDTVGTVNLTTILGPHDFQQL